MTATLDLPVISPAHHAIIQALRTLPGRPCGMDVAEAAGVSPRSVYTMLGWLHDRGFVRRFRGNTSGTRGPGWTVERPIVPYDVGDITALQRARISQDRRAGAAARETEVARQVLGRRGEWPREWPREWRMVATARIANPHLSWFQLAGQLGMTKDQAAGCWRRICAAAGERS